MRVLVTGAAGFLGRYVVARLLARGHSVRAITRPASAMPEWQGKVEIFSADLRVDQNLAAAFEGIDAVLHLAAATSGNEDVQFASTVVGTEKLLDAMARSSVRRLVHVSSLVVYDWSRAKNVMDEQTPLVANPYGMGGYTIAKIWQERLVNKFAEAASWDLTIVRPGFIWGPQHAEIAGMGRNFGRFFIMFGPRARIPLCHVVNCAHFLVEAVENPAAIGQTFNLVDEDDIRVWRYVREYTRRTGVRALLLPVPYLVGYRIAQLASFTSRVLFGNKGKLPSLLTPRRYESQFKPIRFSARKLQERMGWKPPLGFEQCLSQTYS